MKSFHDDDVVTGHDSHDSRGRRKDNSSRRSFILTPVANTIKELIKNGKAKVEECLVDETAASLKNGVERVESLQHPETNEILKQK